MNSDETQQRPPEGNSVERPARRTDEARGTLPRGTPPKFGRYETWRVLGAGAFGRVYLAFDDLMERFVAIKAPKDALPADKHRAFLREARAISEIHHPHVCPVYDVGIEEDLPFLVMKFVRGGTLADLVEREPPTPVQALKFVGQIAQGLEVVHARGIFHRDLKPANVLYDEREKKLLLTDFGVARFADATATLGGTPGTPLYMAPEQWGPGGEFGDISARTDIYALGVMLFEFLTGERLFDGPAYALLGQHCAAPPRKPSAVRGELSDGYDALCSKALAKKQDERHASARALSDAIVVLLRTPPVQREWEVSVPGTWAERPANEPNADWREVVKTPARITTAPGMVYGLDVSDTITDSQFAGVAHLKGLTALTSLDLRHCAQLTDAGLAHLKGLTALTALYLWGCTQLTDAGLAHLKGLNALTKLYLNGCTHVGDAGLAHLRGLTTLTEFFLNHCTQLTDAGLAHLEDLKAVNALSLSGCAQLTDAGLAHLKGLSALTKLGLANCAQLTDAGIAELQTALPNCTIYR